MIERDLRTLKKGQKTSLTKTSQKINTLSRRQTLHEKANTKQFQSIASSIALLPTQEVITKTIQDTIKIVVNGKIDKISEKVDMVGEHLKAQDATAETQGAAIQELSDKIRPLDGAKTWLEGLGTVILYVGGIATAVVAIVGLYYFFHH